MKRASHPRRLPLLLAVVAIVAASAGQSQNRPFDPGGNEAAPPLPQAPPPDDPNQAPPVQKPPLPPSSLTPVPFQARITADTAPGPIVLGELRWSCALDRCKAQAPAHLFSVQSCAELARVAGPVTRFAAAGRSLSQAELRACNADTASRPHPGVSPTSGGLGSRRVSPAPPTAAPSHEALVRAARAFRERAAKLPDSVYTTSCPHPFAEGTLDGYLEASGRDDVNAARKALVAMDTQLGCMSASRFAGLDRIFRDTVLAAAGDGNAPRIAPVVLLFLEYGGGPFREDYLRWLVEEAPALIAALEAQDAWLSNVGLLLQDRGALTRVTGEPARQRLEAAMDGGLDSGRCTLLELELLEDADGSRDVLFCPKDCQELLGDDERTEGLLAGTPPPDVQQECERRQQEKERLRAARGRGIRECVEQFNANSPTMVACVAEGLSGYRRARLATGPRERTAEDIYAKRRCMQGNEEDWNAYMEASQRYRDAKHKAQGFARRLEELAEQIRVYNPDFDYRDVSIRGLTPSECMDCMPDEEIHHDALMRMFAETETDLAVAVDEYIDAYEEMAEAEERVLQGNEQCAAEGTGCSDTCGIQDALAGITEGCLQQATAKPEPEKPGGGRGPSDPNVAKPNPLAPGALPGTMSGLQECLASATGSSGPQGDPACYDRECPDGKVAEADPERPGRCTCVDPTERNASVDFCPGYVDCPEDTSSACECVALRDPGESLGGGDEGPGPRPGLGGPERGPYRFPLF